MTAADWSNRRAQLESAVGFVIRYWQAFAIAALVLTVGTCWHQHNVEQQAIGALRERLHTADSTLKIARPLVKVYDTAIVHDTVKLNHVIAQLKTLHDTARIRDTIWVKQYIATTDSLQDRCTELSKDCEQFRANATAVISAQDTKIKALEAFTKPKPCGFAWALGAGVVRERTAFEIGPAVTVGIGCRF